MSNTVSILPKQSSQLSDVAFILISLDKQVEVLLDLIDCHVNTTVSRIPSNDMSRLEQEEHSMLSTFAENLTLTLRKQRKGLAETIVHVLQRIDRHQQMYRTVLAKNLEIEAKLKKEVAKLQEEAAKLPDDDDSIDEYSPKAPLAQWMTAIRQDVTALKAMMHAPPASRSSVPPSPPFVPALNADDDLKDLMDARARLQKQLDSFN